MIKRFIGNAEVAELASVMARNIRAACAPGLGGELRVFGVPRGGIPVAYLVKDALSHYLKVVVVDHVQDAQVIVDDLIDSGATQQAYSSAGVPFFALLDKRVMSDAGWIVFPWESASEAAAETIEDNFRRVLQYVGEDPTREGLIETPARATKAWEEWTEGYTMKPEDVLKVFEDGAEHCDEMVVVKDIPVYSHCEHHMAAIFGTATVAYIPNGRIVGLSKLSRLVNVFAHRLQVQERLTNQIADALQEHLKPTGAGVLIRARHLCMESRGVCQQGHHTITSALRGMIKEDPSARAEFLQLAR